MHRRVRDVAERQAAVGRLTGSDLAVRVSQGLGKLSQELVPSSHDAATCVEERVIPEPQLITGCGLLADGPQQAVALLERPTVRAEIIGVGREAGRRERIERSATQRR